jgi:hypothetical protein
MRFSEVVEKACQRLRIGAVRIVLGWDCVRPPVARMKWRRTALQPRPAFAAQYHSQPSV